MLLLKAIKCSLTSLIVNFTSNHICFEKKGNLCYSLQMELQEYPFRAMNVISLKNMVHEAQVQKVMKINWIIDE